LEGNGSAKNADPPDDGARRTLPALVPALGSHHRQPSADEQADRAHIVAPGGRVLAHRALSIAGVANVCEHSNAHAPQAMSQVVPVTSGWLTFFVARRGWPQASCRRPPGRLFGLVACASVVKSKLTFFGSIKFQPQNKGASLTGALHIEVWVSEAQSWMAATGCSACVQRCHEISMATTSAIVIDDITFFRIHL
jgi:hypothetical protein